MKAGYEPPNVKDLGTLVKMTEQSFNKVGRNPDVFTNLTNGVVIGSLVSSP